MHIGIIGFGEVGQCLAAAIAEDDTVELIVYEPRADDAACAMAQTIGGSLHGDVGEQLSRCAWILSCVPGSAAAQTAQNVVRHGVHGQVLFDLATAPPETKRLAAGQLEAAGLHYVDVAIMGAISIGGAATPMLAAGDAKAAPVVEARNWLADKGFKLDWLDGNPPGDAASLKLLRSVFTKGMEALAVECLVAAEHFGVRKQLYDVLADIDQTPLSCFLDMLVSTHVVHAERRLAEIEQAELQLRQAGLPTPLIPSVKALFAQTRAATKPNHANALPSPEDALATLKTIGVLNASQSPNNLRKDSP